VRFAQLDMIEVVPPGQHPSDPYKTDIDPIGFALNRVQTELMWIGEHWCSFTKLRESDPNEADKELGNLRQSLEEAVLHMQRLTELVVAGYSIDPNKRLPAGLTSMGWSHRVEYVRNKQQKSDDNL
jgi:hypothetical protein